jgi:hypothetical protein
MVFRQKNIDPWFSDKKILTHGSQTEILIHDFQNIILTMAFSPKYCATLFSTKYCPMIFRRAKRQRERLARETENHMDDLRVSQMRDLGRIDELPELQ